MTPRVFIQTQDFDLTTEVAALRAGNPGVGAVCAFVGTVRDRNAVGTPAEAATTANITTISAAPQPDTVLSMELEHYPGMTERAIESMVDAAFERFDILGARVIHRVGVLQPLAQIVLVVVTSAHRGQSYQACEFLMDYLKSHAPFWKKEQTPAGARWVDARVSDDAAAARWGLPEQLQALR